MSEAQESDTMMMIVNMPDDDSEEDNNDHINAQPKKIIYFEKSSLIKSLRNAVLVYHSLDIPMGICHKIMDFLQNVSPGVYTLQGWSRDYRGCFHYHSKYRMVFSPDGSINGYSQENFLGIYCRVCSGSWTPQGEINYRVAYGGLNWDYLYQGFFDVLYEKSLQCRWTITDELFSCLRSSRRRRQRRRRQRHPMIPHSSSQLSYHSLTTIPTTLLNNPYPSSTLTSGSFDNLAIDLSLHSGDSHFSLLDYKPLSQTLFPRGTFILDLVWQSKPHEVSHLFASQLRPPRLSSDAVISSSSNDRLISDDGEISSSVCDDYSSNKWESRLNSVMDLIQRHSMNLQNDSENIINEGNSNGVNSHSSHFSNNTNNERSIDDLNLGGNGPWCKWIASFGSDQRVRCSQRSSEIDMKPRTSGERTEDSTEEMDRDQEIVNRERVTRVQSGYVDPRSLHSVMLLDHDFDQPRSHFLNGYLVGDVISGVFCTADLEKGTIQEHINLVIQLWPHSDGQWCSMDSA